MRVAPVVDQCVHENITCLNMICSPEKFLDQKPGSLGISTVLPLGHIPAQNVFRWHENRAATEHEANTIIRICLVEFKMYSSSSYLSRMS